MANFYNRVSDAAVRFPAQHAIELQTPDALLPTTYQRLVEDGEHFAAWLHAQGLGVDDRVALLGDNDARWISAYLGILRLGAIAVPLDTAYKATQVSTVLVDSGARVIFTTTRYVGTVEEACSAVETAPLIRLMHDELPGATAPEVRPRSDADAAVILYTSGTTSDPKGVVLTHGNLEAERQAAFAVVEVTERDAILGVLPLFHSLAQMANLLLPLAVGARVVFLQNVNSTALLEALQARRITIFACVPQFFYLIHQRVMAEVAKANPVRRALFHVLLRTNGLLRTHTSLNPGRRWFAKVHAVMGADMRLLVTGGSRFDPSIGRDLYDMGFLLLNAYGLTETSGGATIVRPGDRHTSSVGVPLPGVDVRIAAREADADRDQEDGEVLIRGPIVMREYFRRPDATAESLKDGWLQTGDLGRLDDDGRLYITGRKKEMIVLASGKNLYPEEIEAHYRQSGVIRELCVLGLSRPGEPIGERLHAVIVPDDDALKARGVVNIQQLIRFEVESLGVQLPPHKRILTYDIWMDPLPRTTTGKVRRHLVEKRLHDQTAAPRTSEAGPLDDEETRWLELPAHAAAFAFVVERLGRSDVRPHSNLDLDLALDSMERVELLTALERHKGGRVAPEVRSGILTVRQLVEAVLAAGPGHGVAQAQVSTPVDHTWQHLLTDPVSPELEALLRPTPWLRAAALFVLARLFAGGLRLLTGGRVEGQTYLPRTGACIVCPNHQSYLDPFLVAGALPFALFRRTFAVGAAEYFQSPLMRRVARWTHVIPVDADSHLEDAMKAGAAGLRLGRVLLLFPEGERSIDGELKPFRKGAAILSAHCDVPIIPVAMDGLYVLWPRGRRFNWPGLLRWKAVPVRLAFGTSITAAPEKYADGTQALRDAVGRLFDALRRRF